MINTAFTAGTDTDEGNLVLEKEHFYDAIKPLKEQKSSINIAIGHHPIAHFVAEDQRTIWNCFNDYNIDFYLCGHLHKGAYDFNLSGERTIPTYQCGSGKVDKYATVTFFVGELDIEKKSGELISYQWLPKEECWAIGGIDGRRAISGKMDIKLERQFGETVELAKDSIDKGEIYKPVEHDQYVTMLQESERTFIVTHDTNIKPVYYFVGRETELQGLCQRIEKGQKSVLVSGMGGIGKTQICRKLFEEYANKNANNESIPFRHIGYIEYDGDINSSLQNCLQFKKQRNPEQNQEAAWKELEYLASDGKLLLFVDNLNKSISEDPGLQRLKKLPGAVIITSRQASFSDEFEPYPIDFLDKQQCIDLFEKIRFGESKGKISTEEYSDLEYIIEKLIGKHTITVEYVAYLSKWKVWSVKELREALERNGFRLQFRKNGELINIQKSYEILYDLSELTKAEQNILEAFSVLPYIPLEAKICKEWMLTDAKADKEDEILMELYQKGWLQLIQESYALHPVFAQFIYENCRPMAENHVGLIDTCQRCLEIPESGSALKCQKFIPFAENISEKLVRENEIEQVSFICDIAYLLNYIAEYKKAQELYEKAIRISERILGEEHPDTAAGYNNLAIVYDNQGKYEKAEELYEKSLRIRERILGKEHPDTARSYNNLAAVYSSQGKYEKAEELYKKAIRIRERILGEEHPNIAASYNNLAVLYDNQGKYENAEELYEKALRIREHILGEEHPSTATSYNNLAVVYERQRKYEKAEELYRKALRIRERILGEEHLSTATSYHNLAGVYDNQGKYEKAEELYGKALRIRERILGKEHPDTAISYNNLAGVYTKQGKNKSALSYYLKSYTIFLRRLGQSHPNTQIVYKNMQGTYFKWKPEGDFEQWIAEEIEFYKR